MNILVVDDDTLIRDTVVKYGRRDGFEVDQAANGFEAIELCEQKVYDMILLDIMMPRMDGYTACKKIRALQQPPIIMLSALGQEYDKLLGFDLGISDYLVKPFSFKELMMRIKALTRLAAGNCEAITTGELKIDLMARSVQIEEESIPLTPKETALLLYLAKNHGIALPREKLICDVWGYDYEGSDRTLDSHVKSLRKSLREYGKCIVTIKGVGYRFDKK